MVSFHIIPLAYKTGSHLLITNDFSTKRYSSSATFLQNGFQATQWHRNKQMQQKACFKTGVIIKGIICKTLPELEGTSLKKGTANPFTAPRHSLWCAFGCSDQLLFAYNSEVSGPIS